MSFLYAFMVILLICLHTVECVDGDLRIVAETKGAKQTEGRLEMCFGGVWSVVENYGYNEGATACRQMGYLDIPSEYYT